MLRTSLSLSSCLGIPFSITNIRKNRKKPGLMPQHLTGVQAAAVICEAHVEGGSMGSTELLFRPAKPKAGAYRFDIGTAGSTTLLLQTLLPPLILAEAPSTLLLAGGTHVPMSPPFNYVRDVFIPYLKKLGAVLNASIESYGFYPKGGGRILVQIFPQGTPAAFRAIPSTSQPKVELVRGVSGVANLPLTIAERQKDSAARVLDSAGFSVAVEAIEVTSPGPGTFIFLKPEGADCPAGFSSIGERGKRAEKVGAEAAQALLAYHATHACLDSHLSDQIALYLAFADGTSSFTTSCVTQHLVTNLWVIEKFLGTSYTIDGELGQPGRVTINGLARPL